VNSYSLPTILHIRILSEDLCLHDGDCGEGNLETGGKKWREMYVQIEGVYIRIIRDERL
jgi:hypothetical protein